MTFYSRNLPHWLPENACIFLTWRLYGSLPCGTVTPDCARRSKAKTCPSNVTDGKSESAGLRFRRLDVQLDRMKIGPKWLADSRVAACVQEAILRGDNSLGQYRLHAYVVMPNHVHLLIAPTIPVCGIMRGIKGVSARDANRILGRKGKAFWQDESYDHWVRSEAEHWKIVAYIENNPVRAGLVKEAAEWRWSSAHLRGSMQDLDAGSTDKTPRASAAERITV